MSFAVTLEENTPDPETFKIPPLSVILFPSVLAPVNFGKSL
jgi:hypothetical protein